METRVTIDIQASAGGKAPSTVHTSGVVSSKVEFLAAATAAWDSFGAYNTDGGEEPPQP